MHTCIWCGKRVPSEMAYKLLFDEIITIDDREALLDKRLSWFQRNFKDRSAVVCQECLPERCFCQSKQ